MLAVVTFVVHRLDDDFVDSCGGVHEVERVPHQADAEDVLGFTLSYGLTLEQPVGRVECFLQVQGAVLPPLMPWISQSESRTA